MREPIDRREGGRTSRRARQRGAVAVIIAILVPVVLGIAALAVDVGHVYLVRNELQNAADAAALAGAQTLDGTVPTMRTARINAQTFGARHAANGTAVALDLNVGNAEDGDIVLGRWHAEGTPPYFEWISDPAVAPRWINAVKVRGRRTQESGGAVKTWLAHFVGVRQAGVAARAVAVGGGPASACSFPLTIPDCQITNGAGQLQCGKKLTFRNNTADTAGLTNLQPDPPVGNKKVRDLIADARAGRCNAPKAGAVIYTENGSDIKPIGDAINDWIADNGGPITVTIPILKSGQSGGGCNVQFNGQFPVAGFAKIQIVKVNRPGGKDGNTIDIVYLCDQSEDAPAGGSFFGDKATQIYITQ